MDCSKVDVRLQSTIRTDSFGGVVEDLYFCTK